ncbi:hypothetical protein HY572_04840 [Candidatus Micrarchaeota archaeon]|nr:hypothetical protein [Candidatus Micrarchaeota archaeon]
MDLKKIIREMLKKGMSEEQVKDNLRELGVENPDEVFAEATEQMAEVRTPGRLPPDSPPVKQSDVGMREVGLSQSEEEGGHDLFEAEEQPKADKPGFSFTRVSGEGEQEEHVGRSRPAAESVGDLMQSVPETSLSDLDAVERKLDQTIALLGALKDVNQKILQAQRDILLRLK